ncbi:MFS transporter [Novosphingobium panipatense]|uniref:Benzoate transport n=1 Tax=Novosphingobium panipatense TaxID=428991 RepID=A0ABY1QVE3_9SPHN|nr:MFS transporter [Novosphingobium panipatense]SMP80322.1 benzoate transport [Novosphingobium panipatense]
MAIHSTGNPAHAVQAGDPRAIIAQSPMRLRQLLAIATCVALNALDGFDVLSISFASPGISAEWGIDRAALGIVLSMELIGMAAGSVLLGPLADRVGRRPTALVCLLIMALGMAATAHVHAIWQLAAFRLATGIGIGGMLACTNAMVAEYANDRWRGAAVAVMAAGYPMGAIAGGAFATSLLVDGSWRDIFTFGAIASAALIPFLLVLTPESVGYLLQRERRDGTLAKVNRALAGLGHGPVDRLPEPLVHAKAKTSFHRLFAGDLRRTTLLLAAAYFCHVMTFYFILKWVPKIVVDMGYAASAAGGVLVYANVGGLLGALLLSALTLRIPLRSIMIGTMVLSTAMVVWFGQGHADLVSLAFAAAAAGFFTNAGMVGFYALIASSFPTAARGGGTGFVIGVGRGGAALGPVVAGFLFEGGMGLSGVAVAMGLGSLVAAAAILGLPSKAVSVED